MLQTLKKLHKFKKPFYGINSGNYGFLMNKFSNKNFLKNLKNSHLIRIHPLQMSVKTKNGRLKMVIFKRRFNFWTFLKIDPKNCRLEMVIFKRRLIFLVIFKNFLQPTHVFSKFWTNTSAGRKKEICYVNFIFVGFFSNFYSVLIYKLKSWYRVNFFILFSVFRNPFWRKNCRIKKWQKNIFIYFFSRCFTRKQEQ